MIYIDHNGEKIRFDDADSAIAYLQKYKKELFKKEFLHNCDKCVWQHTLSCPGSPTYCNNYKRDPPDGGYYG